MKPFEKKRCNCHHQFVSVCAVEASLTRSEAVFKLLLARRWKKIKEKERTMKSFLLLGKLKHFYLFISLFWRSRTFLWFFERKATDQTSCKSAATRRRISKRKLHAFCSGGQLATVRHKKRTGLRRKNENSRMPGKACLCLASICKEIKRRMKRLAFSELGQAMEQRRPGAASWAPDNCCASCCALTDFQWLRMGLKTHCLGFIEYILMGYRRLYFNT